MKKVAFVSSFALVAAAQAAVLFDNGPVYDVAGSPNLSRLISPNTTLGAGAQISANNAVADNFTASSSWNVTKLTFYMYQTGAASTFTFTGLNYQICTSNSDAISWTAGSISNGGLVAYRVGSVTTDRTRAIFAIDVAVNLNIGPGNYILRWQAAGTLASGPWQPPVVPTNGGGNATQSLAGGAFNPLVDGGTAAAALELPFTISGTEIPAPGALALMGTGALIAARRRR
ncbi:MAG: PEP-CTERM sorting domain-containing protein [Planctomycetes bacterium]|nr:PEP-CTERM sorting domain-containing protein [Planctomycetota bacterium]